MRSDLAAVVLTLLATLVLVMPGVVGVSVLFPSRPIRWRWITGSTLALAASAYLSVVFSYVDIRLFAVYWLLMGATIALKWSRMARRPKLVSVPTPTGWALLIALSLVGLLRIGAVMGRVVPMGWDPTFHMILTQKIILSHRMIHDWLPFEAIDLNYPVGAHCLVAIISLATRVPPIQVFNVLLPLIGVFMCAEVYSLAAAATGKRGLGLFAAITFGFMAYAGSIDYVCWGGLPNAVGVTFLLCYLRLLLTKPFRGRTAMMALLIAAIIVTHHHVMLTTALILLAIAAWAAMTGRKPIAIAVVLTGVLGSLLAMFYVLPYVLRIGSVTTTSAFHVVEDEPLWRWPAALGWCFCLMLLGGIALYLRDRRAGHRRLRISGLVPVVVSLLVALYIAGGIIYPAYMQWRGQPPFTAFTPSRFVSDLVPLLAIFAAIPLYLAVIVWRVRMWGVVLAGIASTVFLLPAWRSMRDMDYRPDYVEAYTWIRLNTPPGTLVYAEDWWAPYFTWRRTLKTNIPASEPHRFEDDERRLQEYIDAVVSGSRPPVADGLVVVRVRAPGETPRSDVVLASSPTGFAVELLYPKR